MNIEIENPIGLLTQLVYINALCLEKTKDMDPEQFSDMNQLINDLNKKILEDLK